MFTLAYVADRFIGAPTEVFVPLRQYPTGYVVSVTGPATVTSAAGAGVLRLKTTSNGEVHVRITRAS